MLKNKSKKGKVYNGTINSIEVSVIQTRLGSPRTAIIMECLKRANVQIAIRIDFCGALTRTLNNYIHEEYDTNLKIGDIIIPKKVFLTDGTSFQYLQKYIKEIKSNSNILSVEKIYASDLVEYPSFMNEYWFAESSEELYSILDSKRCSFDNRNRIKDQKDIILKSDVMWTTDALFCEDEQAIETWRQYGCNSVDMESCIVYLLGNLFNIKTISILSVTDLPDSEQDCIQKVNKLHPELLPGFDRATRLLYDILPEVKNTISQ